MNIETLRELMEKYASSLHKPKGIRACDIPKASRYYANEIGSQCYKAYQSLDHETQKKLKEESPRNQVLIYSFNYPRETS